MLQLTVNGNACTLPLFPEEKLSTLLRERLRLTGTKVGCGEGHCGMCTVLVDGRPVKSCVYPAKLANGKSILTIEGLRALSPEGLLHPLQQAFIHYGAVQCGFCTPAQLLTAYAFLQKEPDPSYADLRKALDGVLCRCGGYEAILQAVLAAARSLRSGEPILPPQVNLIVSDFAAVGQVRPRPDAAAKVRGSAQFTDDLHFPGMLFARVLRAMQPHAILRAIDTTNAAALPGVRAVLTAANLPAVHEHGVYTQDWPILVGIGERVRYMGDALALIAADTQAIADEALGLIASDLEAQPVLSTPQQALAADAPQLHPGGNLLKHITVRKGDVAKGFAQADVVLEHTFYTPFTDHLFMEPECSIAVPLPEGRMEVYVGSQIPYADRSQVAAALGLPEEAVRVRGQITGGGFGGKEDIAGQIHAALLAQACEQPVKLLFSRRESLLVHPKRHATQIRVKLGALRNGLLTAAETELYGDTGAYASLGEKVMTRATTHSCGPYVIPQVKSDCYAVYTNNPPAGAFRGFGVLQSAFAIESMMDMLAIELGMDPFELRKRNALIQGSFTNTGQRLEESVGLMECLEQVEADLLAQAGDDPFTPLELERDGKKYLTCWGIAAAYKNTGLGSGADDAAGADVEILPDGMVQVRSASAEIGQGLVTILQLIVAEVLNRDPQDVSVLLMDTDLTPDGGPTTASRQTYVTGNAALQAALRLRQHIKANLAGLWNISVDAVKLGEKGITAGQHTCSWAELAGFLDDTAEGRCQRHVYHAPLTFALGEGGKIHFAFSFAAQAVQIELCLDDGSLRVLKVISANDAGKVINPLGFQGQVEGGVVMGLGHALMEEFVVEDGIIHTDRMARYHIPSMQDTPQMRSLVVEYPTKDGPFGAKGVGEIVSIPTPPAIANALAHAIGLRLDRLPLRTEDIRAHLGL